MPQNSKKENLSIPNISLTNIIAIIVVIVLVGLGAWGISKYKTETSSIQAVAATQTFDYDCDEGQTALAVLKTKAEVETQDSELGVFVDSINGVANTNNSFWIFYVNGEMATVGADQYTCKTGDKVEWRFEKLF